MADPVVSADLMEWSVFMTIRTLCSFWTNNRAIENPTVLFALWLRSIVPTLLSFFGWISITISQAERAPELSPESSVVGRSGERIPLYLSQVV